MRHSLTTVAAATVLAAGCANGRLTNHSLSMLAAAPAAAAAAGSRLDSVGYVPLGSRSSQRDCAGGEPSAAVPLCRVRGRVDASALLAAAEHGSAVLRSGDDLTFVYRGRGHGVALTGGLQYPMSPVLGTDLWVVTLRVRHAERAIVSYAFYSDSLPSGTKLDMKSWRGPAAGAPAPKATVVAGRIHVDTLVSKALGASRGIVSYVPPRHGDEPIAGVVYMGDGGSVHTIAPLVDTLITTGKLPRIMLIGVPSGMPGAKDKPTDDIRAMEYLWGYEESNAHYLAHERFILAEVIPWAESTLGAPSRREQRAVWGISNSGGWAVTMGLRHPETIGVVLAFSPGGAHGIMPPGAKPDSSVRFLLQGGILEPPFHTIAASWADSLRTRGVRSTFKEIDAGHDFLAWSEQFPSALRWAWVHDGEFHF